MIEPGLASYLQDNVSSVSERVYPKMLPQNVGYPAISYELISDPRIHDQDGSNGLVVSRYQITPWSPSYADMKTTQDEIRLALDGFAGAMGEHHVASARNVGGRDLFDPNGGESGIHHGPVDYMIHYSETVPVN